MFPVRSPHAKGKNSFHSVDRNQHFPKFTAEASESSPSPFLPPLPGSRSPEATSPTPSRESSVPFLSFCGRCIFPLPNVRRLGTLFLVFPLKHCYVLQHSLPRYCICTKRDVTNMKPCLPHPETLPLQAIGTAVFFPKPFRRSHRHSPDPRTFGRVFRTGSAVFMLARELNARIAAIDFHQHFPDRLRQAAGNGEAGRFFIPEDFPALETERGIFNLVRTGGGPSHRRDFRRGPFLFKGIDKELSAITPGRATIRQ